MTAYFTAQESLSIGNCEDSDDQADYEVNNDDEEDIDDLDATLCDVGREDYIMEDVTIQNFGGGRFLFFNSSSDFKSFSPPASFDCSSPRMPPFSQNDVKISTKSPLFAPSSSPRSPRPIPIPVPPPQMIS
uniref:Ovule protein n=1 Tax=Angiostrongylus cantonensis TaxID=6313 RepID=A0A0K0D2I7_ANGCA